MLAARITGDSSFGQRPKSALSGILQLIRDSDLHQLGPGRPEARNGYGGTCWWGGP